MTPARERVLRAVADVAAVQGRPPRQARTQILIGAATAAAVVALFALVLAGLGQSRDQASQLDGLKSLLTTSVTQGQQLSDQIRSLGQTPVVTPLPPQAATAGTPGAAGATGSAGRDGRDGVTPACVSTPTQCVGQPGIPGQDGAAGAAGKDGAAGAPGKDGADGKDGAPGPAPARITQHYADGSSSVCTRDPNDPGTDAAPNYSCPAPTSARPTSVEMP